MKLWTKVKTAVKHWLDHMAEENKKQFGDGPPSCCGGKRRDRTK